MLVGLSIIAVSLSIFTYHYPPSTWTALLSSALAAWKEESAAPTSGGADAASKHQAPLDQLRPKSPHEKDSNSDSTSSPQTTPKAVPRDSSTTDSIPSFTLVEHQGSDEDDDEEDHLPPPSFPALNSAQRASSQPKVISPPLVMNPMVPPPVPSFMAPPSSRVSSSLMPPPSLKASNLRALPTPSNSLRAPTTGPLPNRGPLPDRSPGGGLAPQLAPISTVKTPNSRGKVLLSPGHSPLDWANLQRSGTNLSGVSSLIRVTPSMLKSNNGRKGKPAWSSYQGKVYNITPYLPFHPGGEGELRRASGKDGGKLFMEVHPWVNWENMLGDCVVGIMVSEEQTVGAAGTSSLEDMD